MPAAPPVSPSAERALLGLLAAGPPRTIGDIGRALFPAWTEQDGWSPRNLLAELLENLVAEGRVQQHRGGEEPTYGAGELVAAEWAEAACRRFAECVNGLRPDLLVGPVEKSEAFLERRFDANHEVYCWGPGMPALTPRGAGLEVRGNRDQTPQLVGWRQFVEWLRAAARETVSATVLPPAEPVDSAADAADQDGPAAPKELFNMMATATKKPPANGAAKAKARKAKAAASVRSFAHVIPVTFGGVSIGHGTARIGISIDRAELSLLDADELLCFRRLVGVVKVEKHDDNPKQTTFLKDLKHEIAGAFDTKKLGVTPDLFTNGLTFSTGEIDGRELFDFAKSQGRLYIESSSAIDDEVSGQDAGGPEEDEDDEDDEDEEE